MTATANYPTKLLSIARLTFAVASLAAPVTAWSQGMHEPSCGCQAPACDCQPVSTGCNCSGGCNQARDRSMTLPRLSARLMDNLDRATDSFERSVMSSFPRPRCQCDQCSGNASCDRCQTSMIGKQTFSGDHSMIPFSSDKTLSQPLPPSDGVEVPPVYNDNIFRDDPSLSVPPSMRQNDYLQDPFRDDSAQREPKTRAPSNRYNDGDAPMFNSSASTKKPVDKPTGNKSLLTNQSETVFNRYTNQSVPVPPSQSMPESNVAKVRIPESEAPQRLTARVVEQTKPAEQVLPTAAKSAIYVTGGESTNKEPQSGVVKAAAMLQLAK